MGDPSKTIPEFGKTIRDAHFLLDPTSVHVNHGSWGSQPKQVFDERIRILREIEFQPDTHFRRTYADQWYQSLGMVCKYLNMKKENVVFVENATGAINTILKSIPFTKGDQILIYSWTYKAIRNSVRRTCQMTGAEMVTLELKYPINCAEEVVEKYQHIMETHPSIKLAIIDYISSATATLFPIKDLIEVCRKNNVLSLIDGAHTPGQVNLDVEALMPDFFAGNLHKWVYCPRGTAFMWLNPKHHGNVYPLVTSHYYMCKNWQDDFQSQATRDNSNYLTCPEGVRYHQSLGGIEAIQDYVVPLLEDAAQHLVKVWGTKAFPIPTNMQAPYLRVVRLPDLPQYPIKAVDGLVFSDMNDLMADLYTRFNIHATCLGVQGEPWIRLSGNVYNFKEEYEKFGAAILTLKEEGEKL